MNVEKFLRHIQSAEWYDDQIVRVERLPQREARFATLEPGIDARVASAIGGDGISQLYTHQAEAIAKARRGDDVVVVTGTASGKTLCYNVPVLESILADPSACALYLYPTKALAQDQLRTLDRYLKANPALPLVCGTYDGDTPPNARRKLKNEANVLLTNPDMLHSGILPNHGTWARFLAKLKFVVVDEVHTYRGTFGSNVAHVLGRLNRICEHYGARPTFIGCSATIRNPRELSERLTGRTMHVVDDDGSPRGPKAFAIWNAPFFGESSAERKSANVEAARLLAELVAFDHQSIAFVRARVVSEIVSKYAQEFVSKLSPSRAKLITSYRGGYLPEERRAIERALFGGELKAVVSTNALELGIDIGSMEAAVLVGYPGSIASTWQQAGRAGRGADPSLVVLLPYDSPIDQYMARHPDYFFGRSPESAVIDPLNAHIVLSHVRAAAFELPIRKEDWTQFGDACGPILKLLEENRQVRQQGGRFYWSGPNYPSADVGLRNIGDDVYTIIVGASAALAAAGLQGLPANSRVIGTIDEAGAFQQLHPQAIYIHHGETYFVNELDTHKKIAWVQKEDTDYYTQSITETKIKIEHEELHKSVTVGRTASDSPLVKASGGSASEFERDFDERIPTSELRSRARSRSGEPDALPPNNATAEIYWGDLSVTSVTYMFKKIKFGSRDSLGFGALDLPTQTLDTTGMWLLPHASAYAAAKSSGRVPREGLLGICNVIREVIPLFAMCDTMDIGASVDSSAANAPGIFVHDRFPGGLGFALKAYELVDEILAACLELVDHCECRDGCPSCVGSPLPPYSHLDPDVNARGLIPDKEAAKSILHHLLGREPFQPSLRSSAGSAEIAQDEEELRKLVESSQLPVTLEKKLRQRVDKLRRRGPAFPR
ncbi:MAG TPA: DEAD/DEAH box helicase [Candidatus Krumholzibacteria bacterium]|nr:DEAD/DEAH box helicase [Candidatus Krumholzibacteria bacterium]